MNLRQNTEIRDFFGRTVNSPTFNRWNLHFSCIFHASLHQLTFGDSPYVEIVAAFLLNPGKLRIVVPRKARRSNLSA